MEMLTIGSISSDVDYEGLQLLLIFGIIITAIQFFVAIFFNYEDKEATITLPKSMYIIFYIPLLLLGASLEFLVVMQFSFSAPLVIAMSVIWGVYIIVKAVAHMAEEFYSPLGVMAAIQSFVYVMNRHPYFFEGSIERVIAARTIVNKQNRYLKGKKR